MSWRVARSLDVLLNEVNAAAPKRNKASDGSIGDAAHATRDSDHNPWFLLGGVGIVRARDLTHDPAGGLDCDILAAKLAALLVVGAHPALRAGAYIIWEGRILSFNRRSEGWRRYTGSNQHTKHLHLSVTTDPHGFDSTQPWGVMVQTPTSAGLLGISLSTVREQFVAAVARKPVQSKPAVRRVQKRLNTRYRAGLKVDGLVGPSTIAAWVRHEKTVGPTGGTRIPDRRTLGLLVKGSIYRVVK